MDQDFIILADSNLHGMNLQDANFKGLDLSGVNFTDTNLVNTNFDNTIMNGLTKLNSARLRNTSFKGASFNKVDLRQINFRYSYLKNAIFNETIIDETTVFSRFFDPRIPSRFVEVQLEGLQFNNITAAKINFTNCNLHGVTFNNCYINIHDNCLLGVKFNDAIFNNTTITLSFSKQLYLLSNLFGDDGLIFSDTVQKVVKLIINTNSYEIKYNLLQQLIDQFEGPEPSKFKFSLDTIWQSINDVGFKAFCGTFLDDRIRDYEAKYNKMQQLKMEFYTQLAKFRGDNPNRDLTLMFNNNQYRILYKRDSVISFNSIVADQNCVILYRYTNNGIHSYDLEDESMKRWLVNNSGTHPETRKELQYGIFWWDDHNMFIFLSKVVGFNGTNLQLMAE